MSLPGFRKVHFFILRAPVNIFRNQAQYSSKKTCITFGHIDSKRYFPVLSVNITLPFFDL